MEKRVSDITIGDRFRKDYGDLERLAESLKRFGVIQPLAVDPNLNLLAGGRRYAAAVLAGLETVPVRIIDEPSELVRREIELEENLERKNLTWDEEVNLKAEINKLKKQIHGDYADDRLGGWSDAKTARTLGESPANLSRDLELAGALEVFPALAKEKTKLDALRKLRELKEAIVLKELETRVGDKAPQQWRWSAEHYIVGDTLEGLEKMKAGTAHLIECDPPYGVEIDAVLRDSDEDNREQFVEVSEAALPDLLSRLAPLLFKVAANDAYLLFWFGMRHQHLVYTSLTDAGWNVDPIPAIWVKSNIGKPADAWARLMVRYEAFFVCRKGSPSLAKPTSNVFLADSISAHQRICITEKPVELYDSILEAFSRPGLRAVCPFLGSGNFMLSCYKRNLLCFGWDLSETTKERFIRRVQVEFEYKEPT